MCTFYLFINIYILHLGEGNLIFCCTSSWENYIGSVGQPNNNNPISFRVGTSKNKNIHHRFKETCAQVTYKPTASQQCQVHQIFVFYVFSCDLKDKYHIRRNINCKNKENFVCEISSIIILICQKLGLIELVQRKIKLPSPYSELS